MKHDIVTQREGPDLLAVDDLRLGDLGGKVRLDDAAVTGLIADQSVEDHIHHGAVLRPGRVVRIQRGEVSGIDAKAEDRPGRILSGRTGKTLQPDRGGDYGGRKHRADYSSSGCHVSPPSD